MTAVPKSGKTITVYKITQASKAFRWERSEYYSLSPWAGNMYPYIGSDDGGRIYTLPPEISAVTECSAIADEPCLVLLDTRNNKVCRLTEIRGGPGVIDGFGKRIPLTQNNVNNMFHL